MASMDSYQNRLKSFKSGSSKWPHSVKKHHNVEMFAKAGFYFVRKAKTTDNVRCFLCDVELNNWNEDQSPLTRHAQESPSCAWVLLNFPDATHMLPINEDEPNTYPKSLSMRDARLKTFIKTNDWSSKAGQQTSPSASKFADAGFFYSPTPKHRNRVKCPYCQCSLNSMDQTTRLSARHKELQPDCRFFKAQKHTTSEVDSEEDEKLQKAGSNDTRKGNTRRSTSQDYRDLRVSDQHKAITSNQEPLDVEDSIWDVEKAYHKQENNNAFPRVNKMLTYSKKQRKKLAPMLPPEFTSPMDIDGFPDTTDKIQDNSDDIPEPQPSKETVKPSTQVLSTKDKGKGKATRHLPKKSLSLSRKKTAIKHTSETSLDDSYKKDMEKSASDNPSRTTPPQTPERQTEVEEQGFKTPPRQVFNPQSALQSLYDCHYYSPVEGDSDLKSLMLSPIEHVGESHVRPPGLSGILHSTPITHVGRTRPGFLSVDTNDHSPMDTIHANKRQRYLSPSKSSTRQTPSTNAESYETQPHHGLTSNQLKMTVEEYFLSLVNDSQELVKRRGEEMIQRVKSDVGRIRNEILQSDQEQDASV